LIWACHQIEFRVGLHVGDCLSRVWVMIRRSSSVLRADRRGGHATPDIGLCGPSGFARGQAEVRPVALLADDGEKRIRPHLHDPDASGLAAQREPVVAIRIEVDQIRACGGSGRAWPVSCGFRRAGAL
jgi:hypothetical protein